MSTLSVIRGEDGYDWLHTPKGYECTWGSYMEAAEPVRKQMPWAGDYLRKHRKKYPWSPMFLNHGKHFEWPTGEEMKNILDLIDDTGLVAGQCYQTSLQLAEVIADVGEPVKYCEGLYVGPSGPLEHAWVLRNNRVHDFSIGFGGIFGSYFGIAFNPAFVKEIKGNSSKTGMIANWDTYKDATEAYIREHFRPSLP